MPPEPLAIDSSDSDDAAQQSQRPERRRSRRTRARTHSGPRHGSAPITDDESAVNAALGLSDSSEPVASSSRYSSLSETAAARAESRKLRKERKRLHSDRKRQSEKEEKRTQNGKTRDRQPSVDSSRGGTTSSKKRRLETVDEEDSDQRGASNSGRAGSATINAGNTAPRGSGTSSSRASAAQQWPSLTSSSDDELPQLHRPQQSQPSSPTHIVIGSSSPPRRARTVSRSSPAIAANSASTRRLSRAPITEISSSSSSSDDSGNVAAADAERAHHAMVPSSQPEVEAANAIVDANHEVLQDQLSVPPEPASPSSTSTTAATAPSAAAQMAGSSDIGMDAKASSAPVEQGGADNEVEIAGHSRGDSIAAGDADLQAEDDRGGEGDVSDVSSVTYSDDSVEYVPGEYFYTSSEGSLHSSDSEEGLGSWDEVDRDKWQGTTEHLDDAYNGNFDIRAVLRHRRNPRRNFVEYRTVWSGYPIYSTTWEQESHFNSPKTLKEYWDRHGGRPADMPYDDKEYSTHDSDTDIAVRRRPRKRAHEALKKRRRELRRDKLELRTYLKTLDSRRAKARAKAEQRFEAMRRANNLNLNTERHREKGSTRSSMKRQLKQQQKSWRRGQGGASSSSTAMVGPSRSVTNTGRILNDVSMKASKSSAPGGMARTRAAQLDDGFPDDDSNQIAFRPSTTLSSRPNQLPSFRPATSMSSGGVGGSSSGSGARPTPGSFKGAHKREGKVKLMNNSGFNDFLSQLHGGDRSTAAQPEKVASTSSAGPSTAAGSSTATAREGADGATAASNEAGRPTSILRRTSGPRPNLLVLGPVEDFQGGVRPPTAANTAEGSVARQASSPSEVEDRDSFDIPEMSAYRTHFNRHQPAPPSKITQAQAPRQRTADPRLRTEDPRRKVTIVSPAEEQQMQQRTAEAGWSASATPLALAAHAGSQSPIDLGVVSPIGAGIMAQSRAPSTMPASTGPDAGPEYEPKLIWTGWMDAPVPQLHTAFEVGLWAPQTMSDQRIQELGLVADYVDPLRFDRVYPFALIRESLAPPRTADDALMLMPSERNFTESLPTLDALSQLLYSTDMALLASPQATQRVLTSAKTSDSISSSDAPSEYLVMFSNKYEVDKILGIPPSLRSLRSLWHTVYVIPVRLTLPPAALSSWMPQQLSHLEPSVHVTFDSNTGKKSLEDFGFRKSDVLRAKLAARRYRITLQIIDDIRSSYNIIFVGRKTPSYEKNVVHCMVRLVEGGVRPSLKEGVSSDMKLILDPRIKTQVFIPRSALSEVLEGRDQQPQLALGPFLRRLKRQPRCTFRAFGFSPLDPDESIQEVFPGSAGVVFISMSAILGELLRSVRSSSKVKDINGADDGDEDGHEEGQLTQGDSPDSETGSARGDDGTGGTTQGNTMVGSIARHLPNGWKALLHPWIRGGLKLLGGQIESTCRALDLLEPDEDLPAELVLDLDSQVDQLLSNGDLEELKADSIFSPPFEEPTELPAEPEELVRDLDREVFHTLRQYQLESLRDYRFHVLVTSNVDTTRSEEELAGVEEITVQAFEGDYCLTLANRPGNVGTDTS
ncbi:hypothetical protein BCV70DRAFT_196813 [Testicularia cyperi]|uniref:Chromo domain-containing protein n=1 Tax=Testicularia cyperi TaxID=1882483 RepID=A0A317XW83_9BASI|nr:hypothetical protein BCV70DRAFT_196813 [Testicularia cyperi]